MWKRVGVLTAICAIAASVLVSTPASAGDFGKNCNTYTSPNGNKSVKICTALEHLSGSNNWWSRAWADNVAGQGNPSFVYLQTQFWSYAAGPGILDPHWVSGDRSTTADDGGNFDSVNNWNGTTFTVNLNPHLSPSQHFDLSHAELTAQIDWTGDGSADVTPNFNSSNVDTCPDAVIC